MRSHLNQASNVACIHSSTQVQADLYQEGPGDVGAARRLPLQAHARWVENYCAHRGSFGAGSIYSLMNISSQDFIPWHLDFPEMKGSRWQGWASLCTRSGRGGQGA